MKEKDNVENYSYSCTRGTGLNSPHCQTVVRQQQCGAVTRRVKLEGPQEAHLNLSRQNYQQPGIQ